MSYILEALRRADAERERGVVPGLHSNTTTADPEPAARDRRPLLYAAGGAGVVVLAGVAILAFGPWHGSPGGGPPDVVGERGPAGDGAVRVATALPPPPSLGNPNANGQADTTRPPPVPAQAVREVAPAPVETTGALDRTPRRPAQGEAANLAARAANGRVGAIVPNSMLTPTPTQTPGAGDRGTPVGRSGATTGDRGSAMGTGPGGREADGAGNGVEHYGPPVGATGPARSTAQGATLPPVPQRAAPPLPAQAPAPAQVTAAPPAQTASAMPVPAAAPVKKFEDLPASVRQTMPRFTVGGAIYSDTPSARMLILNGQVYHEGDHPTPDTLLEQIKLKSAVMNYRGMRYEIAF